MKRIVLQIIVLILPIFIFAQETTYRRRDTIPAEKPEPEIIRRKQVKVNLLPTLGDRVDISWEQGVRKTESYHVGFNLVGLITKDKYAPKGVLLHAGYKFFYHLHPTNEEKYHPLNGFYLQPLIMAGYTNTVIPYYQPVEVPQGGRIMSEKSISSKYVASFCNIGKQYILFNRFSLDLGMGLGIGTYTNHLNSGDLGESTPANRPENFGFFILGDNNLLKLNLRSLFAYNAGVRLGYVFK